MVQTIQKDQLRAQLMTKASKQGFITYNDILAVLPDVEQDVALLDDIMDELLEAGIEVVAGGPKPEEGDLEEPFLDDEDDGVEVGMVDDDDDETISEADDLFASTRRTLNNLDELTEDAGYQAALEDRKSTRLNSSHSQISYAVFCLKKKKKKKRKRKNKRKRTT